MEVTYQKRAAHQPILTFFANAFVVGSVGFLRNLIGGEKVDVRPTKAVLSMKIARCLIKKGYELIDIEPSIKYKEKLVFIFKNTPQLDEEFKAFSRK